MLRLDQSANDKRGSITRQGSAGSSAADQAGAKESLTPGEMAQRWCSWAFRALRKRFNARA